VPWAALVALVLFGAGDRAFWRSERVMAVAHRYTPRGDQGDPLVVDAQLFALPRSGSPLIALLGSSQVREGLDCATFERALPGRPCLSLAISGGTPLDALYIQGQLGDRPRTTLLALFPKLMHMGPKAPFSDTTTALVALGAGAPWALGPTTWGPMGFGWLQQRSPTLRYKDAVWALWQQVRSDPRAHWRLARPPVPEQLLAQSSRQPEQYFVNRIGVLDRDTRLGPSTRLQHAAVERFLAREHAEGRRPFVVDFPTHPGYPSTLPGDVRADYAALLARLQSRDDVRFVGSGELPVLGGDDFLDFMHLGPRGRALVSARLAEILAREDATFP
jgi:hypothetical protein